jgi:hypothetical protein
MSGWIDCKKRKPKKGQRVLILLDNSEEGMEIGIFLGWQQFKTFCGYVRHGGELEAVYTNWGGVSYWMPLPEPPSTANTSNQTSGATP